MPQVVGQPAPAGTGLLGAASCADATHCWAVGVAGPNADTTATTAGAPVTVITATTDGGLNWAAEPLTLPFTPELTGIACPTLELCIAVGSTGTGLSNGTVLTTHDGGATWSQASVPTGAFDLNSVTCMTAAVCTAIVNDGTNSWSAQTDDFGGSWAEDGDLPTGFEDPRDLSCRAADDATGAITCLVAGYSPTSTGHGQGAIAVSQNGGISWTAADVPSGVGVLQNVTCQTPTACIAVGTTSTTVSDVVPAKGQVLLSADDGQTWALSPTPTPVDDIFGVACPTALTCAVVGTVWRGPPGVGTGSVAQSEDGGTTFTRLTSAYVPLTLTAISCPSASLCVAVGGDSVARIALTPPSVPKVAGPTGPEHLAPRSTR